MSKFLFLLNGQYSVTNQYRLHTWLLAHPNPQRLRLLARKKGLIEDDEPILFNMAVVMLS